METYTAIGMRPKASNGRDSLLVYMYYIMPLFYMHGCVSNALTVCEYVYRQGHKAYI